MSGLTPTTITRVNGWLCAARSFQVPETVADVLVLHPVTVAATSSAQSAVASGVVMGEVG
jgi:hypothetical protein